MILTLNGGGGVLLCGTGLRVGDGGKQEVVLERRMHYNVQYLLDRSDQWMAYTKGRSGRRLQGRDPQPYEEFSQGEARTHEEAPSHHPFSPTGRLVKSEHVSNQSNVERDPQHAITEQESPLLLR